jgi:beta-1,4-mannosyltransferase
MSIEKQRVRVFMTTDRPQSYLGLLAASISASGVDVQKMPSRLTRDWLIHNQASSNSILHFHWPQYSYSVDDHKVTEALIDKWLKNLHFATTIGYRIIWTAHTLYPHDSPHVDLQHKAREGLIELSSAVIVHTNSALTEIQSTFNVSHLLLAVIPHGHYADCYSQHLSSLDARKQLNLPSDTHIFLFFGSIRLHKGLMTLLHKFNEANLNNCTLVIAGRPYTAAIGRQLMGATHRMHSVHCHPFYIPDAEIPIYFSAADVAVLPYSKASTSGVAVLAHSLGKPVIAPAIGGFPEMVPPGTGWLYDPDTADGLQVAMRESLRVDRDAASERCIQFARTLDWFRIASATSALYTRVLQMSR